jgi:hypothetical protein
MRGAIPNGPWGREEAAKPFVVGLIVLQLKLDRVHKLVNLGTGYFDHPLDISVWLRLTSFIDYFVEFICKAAKGCFRLFGSSDAISNQFGDGKP